MFIKRYRMSTWTGPCMVDSIANRLMSLSIDQSYIDPMTHSAPKLGISNVFNGTEKVWFTITASNPKSEDMRTLGAIVFKTLGLSGFRPQDFQIHWEVVCSYQ